MSGGPGALSLHEALQILEAWGAGQAGAQYNDSLNRTSTSLRMLGSEINSQTCSQLGAAGHRVTIRVEKDAWQASIEANGTAAFSIQANGPAEEAFADEDTISAVNDAVRTDDAPRLLELAGDIQCRLHIELLNRPEASGYTWVRTTQRFEQLFVSAGWFATVVQLCAPMGPRRVILQDAGAATLRTAGLVIHGPDLFPQPVAYAPNDRAQLYRAARLQDARGDAPEPLELLVTDQHGLDRLALLLAGVVDQLTWCWIADESRVDAAGLSVTFRGARVVDLTLSVEPDTDPDAAVQLWQWATASTDTARHEAVQQAVSLAVATRSHLKQASHPVLRTARSLYELSQRGAVAEALATRRSAREAAMRAGGTAADAARAAGGKAFDRVVVQILAILGVVIAQKTNLINADITRLLLYAIAFTLVAVLIGLFTIEFPSAHSGLRAFKDDLHQFRDTLSEDDITAVQKLRSLDAADQTLAAAELMSIGVLLLAVFGTVVLAIVI